MKAGIAVRLAQKNMSLASLAKSQAVRHLQKLFEADGQTFSGYLLERRLERARDLSYFNRTFKKRFGAPPPETRSRGKALLRSIAYERAGSGPDRTPTPS